MVRLDALHEPNAENFTTARSIPASIRPNELPAVARQAVKRAHLPRTALPRCTSIARWASRVRPAQLFGGGFLSGYDDEAFPTRGRVGDLLGWCDQARPSASALVAAHCPAELILNSSRNSPHENHGDIYASRPLAANGATMVYTLRLPADRLAGSGFVATVPPAPKPWGHRAAGGDSGRPSVPPVRFTARTCAPARPKNGIPLAEIRAMMTGLCRKPLSS